MTISFEETYPNITDWVESWRWIEIGQDDYSTSFVKAFKEGGTVWQGADEYDTLDDALRALDAALEDWLNHEEKPPGGEK